MSGHTQGPWKLGRRTAKGKVSIDAESMSWLELAKVVVVVSGKPSAEGEANARLIAAAPEMLNALKAIVMAEGLASGDLLEVLADALPVIAKAEGKS